ncbi:hypothetical protein PsorP6_008418 [Peronosclerospora sorghi]|uniref:Uncharacterized protein n=1 Tax=Peronosclerospora sorghi TaxID=230839 RepID=A0ACC0W869_9STRA|nr:hypothetical protein PsorP6_008418 [Peronosclerospora sorghi]
MKSLTQQTISPEDHKIKLHHKHDMVGVINHTQQFDDAGMGQRLQKSNKIQHSHNEQQRLVHKLTCRRTETSWSCVQSFHSTFLEEEEPFL